MREEDITCCDKSRRLLNVLLVGDKYSKIKMFNYPCRTNKIFNKYSGHSNEITAIQFTQDEQYVVSVGGEEKSIILWKYDPDLVNNEYALENILDED